MGVFDGAVVTGAPLGLRLNAGAIVELTVGTCVLKGLAVVGDKLTVGASVVLKSFTGDPVVGVKLSIGASVVFENLVGV